MAFPPVSSDDIETTKALLLSHTPEVPLLDDGAYFADPDYLDRLPSERAKGLICEMVTTGDFARIAEHAARQSTIVLAKYDQSRDPELYEIALATAALAIKYGPAWEPNRAMRVRQLANVLEMRWRVTGEVIDFEIALKWRRRATGVARGMWLATASPTPAAESLPEEYLEPVCAWMVAVEQSSVDDATEIRQWQVTELYRDLNAQATLLVRRAGTSDIVGLSVSPMEGLDESVRCLSEALTLDLKPESVCHVHRDLGFALSSRWALSQSRAALDESLKHLIKALHVYQAALPAWTLPDEGHIYRKIAELFGHRYRLTYALEDLDSSIRYFKLELGSLTRGSRAFTEQAIILAGLLGQRAQVTLQLNYFQAIPQQARGSPTMKHITEAQEWITAADSGSHVPNESLRMLMERVRGSLHNMTGGVESIDLATATYDRALSTHPCDSCKEAAEMRMFAAVSRVHRARLSRSPEDYLAAAHALDTSVVQIRKHTTPSEAFEYTWNVAECHDDIFNAADLASIPEDVRRRSGHIAWNTWTELIDNGACNDAKRIQGLSYSGRLALRLLADPKLARDRILRAVGCLDRAKLLYSSRLEQLRMLQKYFYLPGIALAMSLGASDSLSFAVSLFEKARGMIWQRLLLERSSTSGTDAGFDPYASERDALRKLVFSPPVLNKASWSAADEERLRRHEASERLEELDLQLRGTGLGDAGDVLDYKEIAADGTVILVNMSKYGSDAVLIESSGIRRVELGDIDVDLVVKYRSVFLKAVHPDLLEKDFAASVSAFERIMSYIWEKFAAPIIKAIATAPSGPGEGKKPRVFWLSTTLTGFFPIHLAGDYQHPAPGKFVYDHVISSYTPSIQVLKHMRARFNAAGKAARASDAQVLLVGMRTTPGMSTLKADAELAAVRDSLRSSLAAEPPAPLLEPTTAEVLQRLPTCSMVHFACHGVSHEDDPSLSKLLLADWKRSPLTVRKLLAARLPHCQLAYLSACETMAIKKFGLQDEGIHLAGGFHMAGVPQVVSTSWSVDDDTSAALAAMFYALLADDEGRLDFRRAAFALDGAAQVLREQGVHALLWGAYVHSGV
ncbi:hypothetical protein LTR53_002219 [Teratosphaeriaceae sp. CCFEE 6253]|nr:hypothetical protein LTR53_002219 [Teratosphaeriaceae sp. CCFEE 6253]